MVKKISKEIMDCVDADIKAREKKPAANSLTKQRIDKLFRMFCFHSIVATPDMIKECSGCILREIPWQHMVDVEVAGGIDCKVEVENLCYAIWHEGILND